MLGRLIPAPSDHQYGGSRVAIWLLGLLAAVKTLQGTNVMFQARKVLEGVDRVPVSTFPPDAAAHVVFLMGVWGMCVALLGSFGMLATTRYRALIPLASLLLLGEQLGRQLLAAAYLQRPFFPSRLAAAPMINRAFLLIALAAFTLSLRRRAPTSSASAPV